ncbi:radical SAM protein [Candidatus Wolfebacteria bacterium]|nr:radical SAM protein [Candidatus Wolfebacteria bacterium]
MTKILFIVPPYISYESFVNPDFNERAVIKKSGNYGSIVTDMPIGLLSLSAYLKKHSSAEVMLIDFNIILNKIENFDYGSFSELYRDVLMSKEWIDYAPDIIGISALFTPTYHNMIAVGQVAKDIFFNALIISGGGMSTVVPGEIFRDSDCFDALCYGEGEKPLLGLVMADNKKEFLKNNLSWITKEKVKSGQQFQYDFIADLDEIPPYDYGILKIQDYGLNPTVKNYVSFGDGKVKQVFHIATSRGCPHRCCFCASHQVHGRKMRYHSVGRVKEDLECLKEKYEAETIGIQDDSFMVDKKRALEIINVVKELEMKIFFQSGLALYALDRNMLEAIKAAGLNELVLAVESGSSRVLKKIMRKPVSLPIIKRVVDDCRQLGISTDVNILIGLPGETKQDIEDTRNFLKTLPATWFRFYIATPLVGSEMFDICVQNNYLKGDYIGCDFKRAIVETEDFTPEYIKEIVYFLNLELNFVCNSDFKLGNYETALKGFENVIRVKSDHAIAYYYAAKCYEKLGNSEKSRQYADKARQIAEENPFWRNYMDKFNIPYNK